MKFASFVPAAPVLDDDVPASNRGYLFVVHAPGQLNLLIDGEPEESALAISAATLTPYTKYIIFNSPLKGLQLVDHDEMFKSKDQWSFRGKTEVLSRPVANFYYHDTWESSVFFSNLPPISVEDFEAIDRNTYIHDWIESQYAPGDYHIAHNTNLRMNLFRQINTIDSLVALEQQVDLQQQLLVALLTGAPMPDWADDYVARISAASCLESRPADDVLNDCIEHKSKVRAAQQSYLTERKQRA